MKGGALPSRGSRPALGPRWLSPIAALALAAAACGGSPRDLAASARLTDALASPLPVGAPVRCAVAGEIRPSLGCLAPVEIVRQPVAAIERGAAPVALAIPAALRAGRAVVDLRIRGPLGERIADGATLLLEPGTPELRTALPLPAGADLGAKPQLSATAVALPPAEQRFATRPIDVAAGAELSVGLGFEELLRRAGPAPVEFAIAAETGEGTRELLRETLDPLAAEGWSDRRVPLRALAGRSARFVFTSRVVPRATGDETAPPREAFSAPLWGAPMLLAPASPPARRNVVLISLDTLRGDFVGGALDGRRLTPEIDRIAERGTTFERAWSAYPSTTASHMSMLTGLYPSVHGAGVSGGASAARPPTLATFLGDRGWVTSAVTEDAMLFAEHFAPGFDFYREFKGVKLLAMDGAIEETFAAGVAWLAAHPRERFFLFLHTYQVHEPYLPPPIHDLWKTWQRDGATVPIDDGAPLHVRERALYAGETHYTDAIVGRLFRELERLDLLRDSIVVLTSDHGEEFHEHGGRSHTRTVYEELLHVPLIVVAPGLAPAGLRVRTPVSLVDLVPTLLAWLGVDPPAGVQGKSLAGLLRGDPFPEDRSLFAERGPLSDPRRLVAARRGDLKWIFQWNQEPPREIYDLAVDPRERSPLDRADLAQAGAPLREMHRAMRLAGDRARAAVAARPPGDETGTVPDHLDEDTAIKLRALGYLD